VAQPPWLTLFTPGPRPSVGVRWARRLGPGFSAAGCRVRQWAEASWAGHRPTPASRAGGRNRT
jgi:hypothetical protein